MVNDPIVESILKERYFQPGESSWDDIAKRVADYIGNDDNDCIMYYEAISRKEIIPNSPCLMNAGRPNGQLSACFSIPVKDSVEDIFDAIKACALIHKSGGGTGISLSKIRAKGSLVKSNGKVASGPISYMKVFNESTETIKQSGARRGANVGHLNVDHPDIIDFIKCKEIEGDLTNFNISVNITDDFMNKLHEPRNKEIYNLIVHGNWLNGEPGIIFSDAAEKDNACSHLGKLTETNPCCETRLFPWESCNLASINLMKCVDDNGEFNYNKFDRIIRLGVKFLDDMIDKNHYPLIQIDKATKLTRKIGLGVMGFADLLIAMGYVYGDKKSLEFADKLFKFMREIADDESEQLAKKQGTYPVSMKDPRRNAAVLSIAPTGSISLFAGVSSGIEPNFGWVYKRSTWVNGEKKTYDMVHPLFEKAIKNHAWKDSIIKDASEHGTIQGSIYSDMETFVVSKDIKSITHVRMQAIIQKHVDQAISKTINCSSQTSEDEIATIIKTAWKLGCKGITIYREGSRDDVVLETNASKKSNELVKVVEVNNPVKYKLVTATGRILPKTPRWMMGATGKIQSGCGKLLINIAEVNGRPHTIMVENLGGGCESLQRGLVKMTALALRWGVPIFDIVKVLKSEKCNIAMKNPNSECKSCSHALGLMIEKASPDSALDIPPKYLEEKPKNNTIQSKIVCPDCGEGIIFIEGCRSCPKCGWSRCI